MPIIDIAGIKVMVPGGGNPPQDIRNYVDAISSIVAHSNIGRPVADWGAAQLFLESNRFKSDMLRKLHNPGAIKWINDRNRQNASKGPAAKDGGFFAAYPTATDFYNDYGRVLRLGPGYPYQATSIEDFVNRLKTNNYFGKASPAAYLKGLKANLFTAAADYQIKETDNKNYPNVIKDMPKDPAKDPAKVPGWYAGLADWQKGLLWIGGGLLAVKIISK